MYVFFIRRTPTKIFVRESHVERMGQIQDVSYEILNVLEFNRQVLYSDANLLLACSLFMSLLLIRNHFLSSTRKRQSVICRYPDGRLVLYCKAIIH